MTATNPLNSPLSDDDLERLSVLIDRCHADGYGPPLELVDGLLSAAIVCPTMIPPSEYLPLIFGEEANWESMEQAQEALDLLMRFHNQVAQRIALPLGEDDEISEEHWPLLMLPDTDAETDPDDPLAGIDEDFPLAAAWADGFLLGVNLRSEAFQVLEDEIDWLGDDLEMLAGLAEFDDADDDNSDAADSAARVDSGPALTLRERFEQAAQIPFLLKALNDHRLAYGGSRTPVRAAEKPGRNDPCSCGSGRKYKRCCGAN